MSDPVVFKPKTMQAKQRPRNDIGDGINMSENNMTFTDVYDMVKRWVQSNQAQWERQGIKIEIVNDADHIFHVYFTFKHCMGEILVDDPHWAPYRYYYCDVLSLGSTKTLLFGMERIYFFYDLPICLTPVGVLCHTIEHERVSDDI